MGVRSRKTSLPSGRWGCEHAYTCGHKRHKSVVCDTLCKDHILPSLCLVWFTNEESVGLGQSLCELTERSHAELQAQHIDVRGPGLPAVLMGMVLRTLDVWPTLGHWAGAVKAGSRMDKDCRTSFSLVQHGRTLHSLSPPAL